MAAHTQLHNLDDASDNSKHSSSELKSALASESDRFKLWIGDVEPRRSGIKSLSYRLRDAPHIMKSVHDLLSDLAGMLMDAVALLNGEEMKQEEQDQPSDSDSDSEPDNDPTSPSGPLLYEKQLEASIVNTIDCLFRLSITIHNPAPLYQAEAIDESALQKCDDTEHVLGEFPLCEDYLIVRLGNAISCRRRYFAHREKDHQRMDTASKVHLDDDSQTDTTVDSTESAFPHDDHASLTSYATSVNREMHVPQPPAPPPGKQYFECPYCFMMVSINTAKAWKQHVYRDLRPYCCTFEQCTTPNRLFYSRRAWFKHEMEVHRINWQCITDCDRIFDSEELFITHFQSEHPEIAREAASSIIKRMCAKPSSSTASVKCPLCKQTMSLHSLQGHLGRHQKQLALFALPSTRLDEREMFKPERGVLEPELERRGLEYEKDRRWLESQLAGRTNEPWSPMRTNQPTSEPDQNIPHSPTDS
ncbi:hypothetical protein FQN57_004334 [Myotisia sp. PD_48]|nr:hypothetical protein FQN57_004334 [Myotisia sp. PD_48]